MTQRFLSFVDRVFGWFPALLATALVALVCAKAIMSVDLVWDSLSYHIPFAAMRSGLMAKWQFQREVADKESLTAYYQGFPILADLVKGWMWRLTGVPEAVNLYGMLCLLMMMGYLWWAFRLPATWVIIGLLAVPAIQTAAAGNYVDIPANAMFTIVLFSICDLWTNPEKFRKPAPWIVLFVAAFAAANIKLQTSIFVCLAMPFVVWPAWRLLRDRQAERPVVIRMTLLGVVACLAIAVNLIKNLINYKNPFYPIDIDIAGIHFAGPLVHDAWLVPGRGYGDLPRPLQWLISVMEFHSLDGRAIPYDNGMGNVPYESLSAGMGGFLSFLVVAGICFLVLAWRERRDRFSLVLLVCFAISGAVISVFPNSHNLRYETFWMMFLIVSCLLLLRQPSLQPYLQCFRIVLFASLAFVTAVTGGIYFQPVWLPTQQYVDQSGAGKLLEAIVQPGDTICLEQGKGLDNRMTILFAPIFHQKLAQERNYRIREGFCTGYKTISSWR